MKLKDLINDLIARAQALPNVHTVYEGSIYDLNERKDIEYGAVVITQGTHRYRDGFAYFNFEIFYVDRLTETADNKVDCQSHGIDVLSSILYDYVEEQIAFHTFTQRFESECAGAYASVEIIVPFETPCF